MLNKKIPTLFGIFLLLLAVGATVFGVTTVRRYLAQASPQIIPKDVRITNITDSSFTVSYITDGSTTGSVVLAGGKNFSDDRDTGLSSAQNYSTHYISVKGLKPATKYQFKIFQDNSSYELTTSPIIPVASSLAEPIYGTVSKSDGSPAAGAIVYLEIPLASPLSSLVKGNGNFLLPVNNLRSSDLSSLQIPQDNSPETMIIEGGADGRSTVNCFFGKDKPVPGVILGKDSSCQKTQDSLVRNVPSVTLVSPSENGVVSTSLPTFRGTAPAQKIIQIEVHSPTPVVSSLMSNSDGTWSWTPSSNLSPGQHTVTLTYVDDLGKSQKIIRNFTVEAAGAQSPILPPVTATPSAQPIVVSPPVIVATPSATTPPPPAGSMLETLLLLTAGLFLVTLGIGLIKKSVLWT